MKTTEEAADMVLRAAGSALANYTMPATREAIFAAVRAVQMDAMTPAEFNSLPLEQKKDSIVRGDIVVTDIGARLVYFDQGINGMACDYSRQTGCVYIRPEWVTDIIRPAPKEQPAKVVEIVNDLRNAKDAIRLASVSHNFIVIAGMFAKLADHFEREATP